MGEAVDEVAIVGDAQHRALVPLGPATPSRSSAFTTNDRPLMIGRAAKRLLMPCPCNIPSSRRTTATERDPVAGRQ